ncbi:hypothetical protein BDDG_11967 [Blastomyces dermatitidis ATCC 18188]|uniref:NACHT domain-containing protein n=1 Tax=Ajellomyces dermatitidis (strain ATCC 18188 / CBS 674.68) TaxID=653446 RepID=A0A0J9EM81_AJEDA|nr:hypothetical protein BDDG_11967 [Blastomyces dermatitidis ATCC 18188]
MVSLSREQELIMNSLVLRGLCATAQGKSYTRHPIAHRSSGVRQINNMPDRSILSQSLASGGNRCLANVSESVVLSNFVQQIVLERPYLIEHISALGVTDSPLSLDESTHLICRARRDLKRFYLILDGPDECEETSVAVIKKLLAIEPPLTILVSSRPIATVLATLKDCATVCMPQPRSFNDFLAYATIMLNEYPVIAEHLDHNSENIANAAKRIVELSHGLFVLSKVSSNTIINIPWSPCEHY